MDNKFPKRGFPKRNINPDPVSENLIMHLKAATPVKRVGGRNETDLSIFWKDWQLTPGDLNSPTAIWNDYEGNDITAKISHFGKVKHAWTSDTLIFSGAQEDVVEITDDGRTHFAHQEFTIEVWAKVVLGGNKPLFCYESKEGVCAHLRLGDRTCFFFFNIEGGRKAISRVLPEDFDENKINQFVCTFKSGVQKIYLNNQELVAGSESGEIEYIAAPVYIGRSPFSGDNARLTGEIANIRYYKSALSKAEITQNYIAGSGEITLPTEYINVKDAPYGAVGDGVTDDTEAIQRALDAAANYEISSDVKQDDKGNYMKDDNTNYLYKEPIAKAPMGSGNVYIPPGVYMIDANKAVEMRSNTNLYMHGKTTLQAKPSNLQATTVLGIRQVENVGVYGGNIRGDRNDHAGTQGQWGMGVSIINARNVTVEGMRADECWADGFYIGTDTFYKPVAPVSFKYSNPEDIRLIDVKADRNRRQGMSLISGRNVEMIRPVLTNTGGFGDPEGGIDIEPDHSGHILKDIYIEDAVTKNNAGAGILFYLHNLIYFRYLKEGEPYVNNEVSITVNGHHDIGSLCGVMVQDKGLFAKDQNKIQLKTNAPTVTGKVNLQNCIWEKAREKSLRIWDHLAHVQGEDPNKRQTEKTDKDAPVYEIVVDNCKFKNVSYGLNEEAEAHLMIRHKYTAGRIGNIIVKEPVFYDDTGRGEHKMGIIYQIPGDIKNTVNVKIQQPIRYEGGYTGYTAPDYITEYFEKETKSEQ